MIDDITQNPERTDRASQQLQREELIREHMDEPIAQQAMQANIANGVQCPHCGTVNDPDALFCASCGNPIGMTSCPNCGAPVEPDADFCETCRHYIRTDVCSFCGAHLTGQEAFCPECGSPRGGIVCPVCHTLNDFSFCKQCGTPLTDEARQMMEMIREQPEYKEMQLLANEIQQMEMTLPYNSERDILLDQKNIKLRERVLKLLAEDRGIANPVIPEPRNKRMSKEEYNAKKQERLDKLTRFWRRWLRHLSPSRPRFVIMRWPVSLRV